MPRKFRRKERLGERATPASSSNILDHEYSPETGQLIVTFKGGRKYSYEGVTGEIAAGFAEAESKGSYLHRWIIDIFPATKIPLDD